MQFDCVNLPSSSNSQHLSGFGIQLVTPTSHSLRLLAPLRDSERIAPIPHSFTKASCAPGFSFLLPLSSVQFTVSSLNSD